MAHLWARDAGGAWAVLPLSGDEFDLVSLPVPSPASSRRPGGRRSGRLLRAMSEGAAGTEWVLVAPPEEQIAVNGLPLLAGIHSLGDRDEIGLAGESVFFSTETLARIEAMPASQEVRFCPRCKQAIEEASPAVRCPQCGLWHHQSETLPCWLYSSTCAMCPQDTDLEAGFRWTPEDL